jgi:hypothetical protein
MKKLLCLSFAAVMSAAYGQTTFSTFGMDAASIAGTVNDYRIALGPLNGNVNGIQNPNGRREINWDGVPDGRSSPNDLPPDFFNINSPRGVVFSGAKTFRVSADNDNPTNTPPLFAEINPTYADTFDVFSRQRLFSSIDTHVYDVDFFIAGSNIAGLTRGFGAIFCDVDLDDVTKIEYFGQNGELLHSAYVKGNGGFTANKTFSFLGVVFDAPVVRKVRITQGNAALGPKDGEGNDGSGLDMVVTDDFIYGEVVPEPATIVALAAGTAALFRRRRK